MTVAENPINTSVENSESAIQPGLVVYDAAYAEPSLVLKGPDAGGAITLLTSVGLATAKASELKEIPRRGSAFDILAPHIAALFHLHESTRPFLREKQTVAEPGLERQMVELEQWRETARIIENVLPATTKKTGDYKSNIVFGVMKLATAYWSERNAATAEKFHCDDPFAEARAKIGPFLQTARDEAKIWGEEGQAVELTRLCEALTAHLSEMSLAFHRPLFTRTESTVEAKGDSPLASVAIDVKAFHEAASKLDSVLSVLPDPPAEHGIEVPIVGTLDGREYEVSSMSRVDLNAIRDSMADVLGFAEDIFARAHTQAIATRDTGPRQG